ncbi:MAG: hypothetical protein AABY15_01340, partial [Nanoarchaeota archaeon]
MPIDNLEFEKQINKVLEQRQALLASQENAIRSQIALAKELSEALSEKTNFKDSISLIDELSSSLAKSANEAKNVDSEATNAANKIIDNWSSVDDTFSGNLNILKQHASEFPKLAGAAAIAADVMMSAFSGAFGIIKGLFSVISGVVEWVWKLGKSILSLPLKIFDLLVEDATNLMGLGAEIVRAWEAVRKEFGSLKDTVGKELVGAYKNLTGTLTNTGLSVWRVLGDFAGRIDALRELFKGLGATVHLFGKEMEKNIEDIIVFQKGLGLSEEMLNAVGQRAIVSGKTLTGVMHEVANMSLQLGATFDLPQKLIGRDIGKMMQAVDKFGSLTIRQMAESAVYARKLGVEVEKLAGVFDRFDNFEDAALGAAKLSQAFGANVDVMKMMNAQSPADRIDMLRKSMAAAGRDAANMSRQELNLLATTTGLDAATAKQVFSLKNQGKSLDEVKKAGATAEKQQLSQEEAMSKLADSIERVVMMGQLTGGFFDQLLRGFVLGIRMSSEYREVMHNIQKIMWRLIAVGRELGEMFVKLFPGVSKIFKGIAGILDPKKFETMFSIIIPLFRSFFSSIGKEGVTGKDAIKRLLDGIKETFKSMWAEWGEPASDIWEGVQEFGKSMIKIIAGLLSYALEGLGTLFTEIANFLKDPKKAFNFSAADGENSIGAMFAPLVDAIKTSGPMFLEGLETLWAVAQPKIYSIIEEIFDKMAAMVKKKMNEIEWIDWEASEEKWSKKGEQMMISMFGEDPGYLPEIGEEIGKNVTKTLNVGVKLIKPPSLPPINTNQLADSYTNLSELLQRLSEDTSKSTKEETDLIKGNFENLVKNFPQLISLVPGFKNFMNTVRTTSGDSQEEVQKLYDQYYLMQGNLENFITGLPPAYEESANLLATQGDKIKGTTDSIKNASAAALDASKTFAQNTEKALDETSKKIAGIAESEQVSIRELKDNVEWMKKITQEKDAGSALAALQKSFNEIKKTTSEFWVQMASVSMKGFVESFIDPMKKLPGQLNDIITKVWETLITGFLSEDKQVKLGLAFKEIIKIMFMPFTTLVEKITSSMKEELGEDNPILKQLEVLKKGISDVWEA